MRPCEHVDVNYEISDSKSSMDVWLHVSLLLVCYFSVRVGGVQVLHIQIVLVGLYICFDCNVYN